MNEAAENVMPPVDGRDPQGRLCVGSGICTRGQRGTCRGLPEPSEEEGWAGSPVCVWVLCPPAPHQDALLSQAGVHAVYVPSGWPGSWQRTGSPLVP